MIVIVRRFYNSDSEIESKLNGCYPISALESFYRDDDADDLITWPYVHTKSSYDAKYNPDKYILPLDIVKRERDIGFHFAIYLGNEQVAHLPGGGKPTKFDSWNTFCNRSSSSGSSSSSSGGGVVKKITIYHPQIPFKRKEEIIRHIAKVVSYDYGKHSYNLASNNCEHLVNRCVLGLNVSLQVGRVERGVPQSRLYTRGISGSFFVSTGSPSLSGEIGSQSNQLDNLTSNYSYEKGKIEQYIREAENNRSYTRSKYQIEQEKFQERIVIYPKDWCRIS